MFSSHSSSTPVPDAKIFNQCILFFRCVRFISGAFQAAKAEKKMQKEMREEKKTEAKKRKEKNGAQVTERGKKRHSCNYATEHTSDSCLQ